LYDAGNDATDVWNELANVTRTVPDAETDASDAVSWAASWEGEPISLAKHTSHLAAHALSHEGQQTVEKRSQCQLLLCIFGRLVFRSVTLSPIVLTSNDGVIVRLAQTAYEERHMPEGTLDNTRLLVLADALEKAGCTDADILGHLHGPGPHIRGCWPLDLCLDES
jgi:hypothetical protein